MFKIVYFVLFINLNCVYSSSKNLEVLSIWDTFSSTLVLNSTNLSQTCKDSIIKVVEDANHGEVNALKMFDATAKIPPGILNGNVQQYGDFDQCISLKDAQYCLVEIDIESAWKRHGKYSHLRNLVHSHFLMKETFTDPPHRIPGFKMIKWGFCIPKSCSAKDLIGVIEKNFQTPANIRPGMCQVEKSVEEYDSTGYRITKFLINLIMFLIGLSSLVHWYMNKFTNENIDFNNYSSLDQYIKLPRYANNLILIFMGFSLQENISKFFKIKENDSNDIPSLHAIRSLAAIALLLTHKCLVLFFNPYMNRTFTVERLTKPYTVIIRNAIVYTDCFLLISGLLNARSLLNDLKKTNNTTMDVKNKIITRLFRILPNFLAVILFCTYILPSMGSGPLWPVVIDTHSDLCKKYMWRNLLFIHNYFGFESMCLTHTHQLGIDMQLFLITPLLIGLVSKSKRLAKYTIVFLALASTVLRFIITYKFDLFSVIYFGVDVKKMFETADLSYILPTHRATIYLIGVNLAVSLHFSKPRPNWSKLKEVSLWLAFVPAFFLSWLGPYYMGLQNYVYDKIEASMVASLTPLVFGIPVATVIFGFQKNMTWFLGYFFNWKYWQFGTKISYALYLVQFPIYFYNVGLTKHVGEYSNAIQIDVLETFSIIILSIALTICIEQPFMNIKKVLFDKRKCNEDSKDKIE